jgi:Arc/MetJ-type ribon-helix-helix transcriptional regulator
MNLDLPAKIQKLIKDRVKSGKYPRPEDVVAAAVSSLDQQESFGDFSPGELDGLLAEGEKDITNGDVIGAGKAFKELRRLRPK